MGGYNDLFMRDTMDDQGFIPSSDRCLCLSPDIVPVGTQPLAEPLDLIQNDWDRDASREILQGSYNYIYVRGTNKAPNVAEGEVYLYNAPSSILLRPQDWRYNSLPSSGGAQPKFSAKIHSERVLGDNTFLWNAPQQPRGWHYCLVAQVVTEKHPNPIPDDFNSSGGFVNWVRNNPAIAWRNVFIQKSGTTPTTTYLFTFANMDGFEEKYAVMAKCLKMPKGTVVNLACGATGPYPQINATKVLAGDEVDFLYTESTLPAHFEGNLVVSITLPEGAAWPSGASVTPNYMKVVGGENLNDAQMANHEVLALHAQPREAFNLTNEHTSAGQLVVMGDAQVIFE